RPGLPDFTVTAQPLEVVAGHNRAAPRPTRVILTVGARNFLFPELHAPAWAGPRQQPELGLAQQGSDYRAYFNATLLRYRASPLLSASQSANEAPHYGVHAPTG